jgi:CBS domain-containing protein
MSDPYAASRVRHPILRLEVVQQDGTREASHRVFCRLRHASVPVGVCCACPRCDAIQPDPAPSVDCTVPLPPEDLAPDPSGERVEVGALLRRGAVVIGQTTSVQHALTVLRAEDARSVAVVDAERRLVGVVHELAFFPGRTSIDPLPRGEASVVTTMSSAIVVHEATPVRTALRLLAASHLREATVVASDGEPIGVFRDVEGLRWIASATKNGS